MRAGTAKKKSKGHENKTRPQSAAKKRQEDELALSAISNESLKNYMSSSPMRYREKPIMCDSVKKIAMIHAYQPKKLKQCLVTNPKSYGQFYHQNSGLCMINNLYTVSFLAHFREWRKNLRNKLFKILGMLLNFWSLVQLDQVNEALQELKDFSKDLEEVTHVVARQRGNQLSKEASELNKKFIEFRQYGDRLIEIFKQFCESIKQISENLQEAFDGRKDTKVAKKEIKNIGHNFNSKTEQSLKHCSSHPESALMNNAEYRITERMKEITEQAYAILKKIKLLNMFKERLYNVGGSRDRAEEYTCEVLEELVKVMGEHDDLKVTKLRGVSEHSQKFQGMVNRIDDQLNQLIKQFLAHFGSKLQMILQYELAEIKNKTTESCLETGDSRFKLCKKKLLLLLKIFTKKASPQIYERISNSIKQTSQNYHQISQIVEQLKDRTKSIHCDSREDLKVLIKQVMGLVYNFESNRDAICDGIARCMRNRGANTGLNSRRELNRLHNLEKFNHLDDDNLQKLFTVPDQSAKKPVKKQDLKKNVEKNLETIETLCTQKFPQIQSAGQDLNQILNDPLIKKFVTFSGDLRKDQIYSLWIYNEFYKKLIKNTQGRSGNELTKDGLEKMHEYYKSTASKCGQYRNAEDGSKFLQWILQNVVGNCVLDYTEEVEGIVACPSNNQFMAGADIQPAHQNYRTDGDVRKYVQTRRDIVQHILGQSRGQSKYFRPDSALTNYFKNMLKGIDSMTEKSSLYGKYDQPTDSGCYEPSPDFLQQWIRQQFSYCIEESISANVAKANRKQVLGLLKNHIKRIQQLTNDPKVSANLGPVFVEQMKKKKKSIDKLLLLFAEEAIDNGNKIKKYSQLGKSLLQYLREGKIQHVGLFLANQEPITILINAKPDSFKEYVQMFQRVLNNDIDDDDPTKKFTRFYMAAPVQPSASIVSPPKPSPKKKPAVQVQQAPFILEEQILGEESHIDDEVGMIESQINVSKPKINEEKVPEPQCYEYYKINQLGSLAKVVECIKCVKVAPNLSKTLLQFPKLALAFEEKQPNRELCDHLESIVKKLKKNNLMELLNKKGRASQPQKIVQKLLQCLKNNSPRTEKLSALSQALGLIGYTMDTIYDQGPLGNKLIICSNGEHNTHYAYPILINENPESDKKESLPDDEVVAIQKLYLRSLFTTPFMKNRNLDQIKKLTSELRVETCTQTRRNLNRYKEYRVANASEAQQKIKKYLSSKSKEIKLDSPHTIDYASYKNFLQQYSDVVKTGGGENEMHRVCFNNDPNLPLFFSRNQDQVKIILEPEDKQAMSYAILPQGYNKYVERSSFNTTNVNIGNAAAQLEKQLSKAETAHSMDVLSLVHSVGTTSKDKIFGENKISESLHPQKLKQYQIITNSLQVVGMQDPITPKLDALSKYRQFEDAIESLYVDKGFTQPKENEADQQELKKFMQNATPVLKIGQKKSAPVIFDPAALSKVHQSLNILGVEHRQVKYQSQLIGLAQVSDPPALIVSKILGMEENNFRKFRQNKNKDIEIDQLCIYLKFDNSLKFVKNSLESLEYFRKFYILIFTDKNKQRITDLQTLIDKELEIVCQYPKLPMKMQLCKADKDQKQVHSSFTATNYKYESRYVLTAFQETLRNLVNEELERAEQKRKDTRRREEHEKNTFEQERRQQLLERLETQNYLEDEYDEEECIGNVSINLSCDFEM